MTLSLPFADTAPDGSADRVFRIDASRPGWPDLQIRTPAGDWLSAHDAADPRAEARAQIEQALKGGVIPPIAAVIGVGLGHIVEELEARRPDVRIVAVELVTGLAEAARPYTDWSTRDRQGRLVGVADPAHTLPSPAWPHRAIAEKPLVIVNPALARTFPAQYERARGAIKQFFYEQRANAEARRRLAGLYLRHTLENLATLDRSPDVTALDGIAKGEPVILIGAGPSLDRLLPQLRAQRERAWYVALDTALKPLLSAGIVPDLVISVDPTTLNGRHLINLPTRSRPYLVAEMSVDPRAINAFSSRVFSCRIGRADPWPWLEAQGLEATRLNVWGSVLTASCDLLRRMKAGTCLFAAMDLAYTNGQPYCRGTSFEDDWHKQQLRDRLPSIEAVWEKRISEVAITDTDLHGETVRTAPQMVAFRNWVRANATAAGLRIVNVTGAGILHGPDIAQSTLDEALAGVTLAQPPAARLKSAASRLRKPMAKSLLPSLQRALASTDDEGIWTEWAEAIPEFDAPATRQAMHLGQRRLAGSQGQAHHMPKNDTDWIDVPFDPANFAAQAPLTWRVTESDIATYAYRVQGKTMTLAFKINHSALIGQPARELHLRIPGNYLPNRSMANAIWMRSQTARECGYATVHPGLNKVVLLRASEDLFPVEPSYFFLFGQLTFEVQ